MIEKEKAMTDNLISVESIPHKDQRYPTVGDWQWEEDGSLSINISYMPILEYMWIVAIHEIVEALLCRKNGITDDQVTKWDKDHLDDCDPGGIKGCPYYREHLLATVVEHMLAYWLDINWDTYSRHLGDLGSGE